VQNTGELLKFLAVRLTGLAGAVIAAVSLVCALRGVFTVDLPLGIALGAGLGFGRMCMTGRLFSQVLSARHGKMAIIVVNQLLGMALLAAFLFFCVRKSDWLFAGGAAGLFLIPVVIFLNRKKMAERAE
jgi:hypothetical protein